MCKVVYLTSRRFCAESRRFVQSLAEVLQRHNIEVAVGNAYDLFNCMRPHRTYGIALAIDFFKDNSDGCSLTLNCVCPNLTRDFAYNLSNHYDLLTPRIRWRSFRFVTSDEKVWYRFFNKVSAEVKMIFYPATITSEGDMDAYLSSRDQIIEVFADEIIRCLRSNYNYNSYSKSAKAARIRMNERMQKK